MRKGSLVSKALDGARDQALKNLMGAVSGYFSYVRGHAEQMINALNDARGSRSPAECRALALKVMNDFDLFCVAERERMTTPALAQFDADVHELESWLTAAHASDRVGLSAQDHLQEGNEF